VADLEWAGRHSHGAPVEDVLYLTRFATRPAWCKHGVGRALLAAAEVQARAIGAKRLTLPENRRYFEGFGVIATGEGQDAGRPPYIAMERRLTAR